MPVPRLAVRAVILEQDRLLLVNAWPRDKGSDLWCAPGGGVERGTSLPDNLRREVHEETGLTVSVGAACLVNEFHDPAGSFHQVEVFFRCKITKGVLCEDWRDPEGVVHVRRFFERSELAGLSLRPRSLQRVAWEGGIGYDALEPILS